MYLANIFIYIYWLCTVSLVTFFCFTKAFIQLITEQKLYVVWVAKATTKENCDQTHGMNRALNASRYV